MRKILSELLINWRGRQVAKPRVCKTLMQRFKSAPRLHGWVVKLADTRDLKSLGRKVLRVQIPPRPVICPVVTTRQIIPSLHRRTILRLGVGNLQIYGQLAQLVSAPR